MQAKYTAAIGPNMNPDTRVFSPQVMTGKWWVENGPSKMEVLTENKTSGWWMLVVYLPLWKIWVSSSVGMIFHSQLFLESLIKFHGSSHHQPISVLEKCSCFLKTNRPSKHFLVLSNPHFSSLWLSPSSITWKAIQLFHEEQVHVHLPSGNLT